MLLFDGVNAIDSKQRIINDINVYSIDANSKEMWDIIEFCMNKYRLALQAEQKNS